jgi:hypothetical protein
MKIRAGSPRRRRLVVACVLGLALSSLSISPAPVVSTTQAAQAAATFTPAADTFVSSQNPNANYGTSYRLHVDKQPVKETYIRFDVTGTSGTVDSATLRLYSLDASGQSGGTVAAMSNASWSETAVTYATRPAIDGPSIATLGPVSAGAWYEVDVTAAVTGNGAYSFGITSTSTNGSKYQSREHASRKPQLVITFAPPAGDSGVLVGAGDIAKCSSAGDDKTASLLDSISGTVFTTGDNAYPDGSIGDFTNCYEPSWGRHKSRTRPSAGNHEYITPGATGYFTYFGAAAGDPGEGYYSYYLGSWLVVVLNSNCARVGGCGPGSPQELWLRQQLATNPTSCTVAYWHHPRFSSGSSHGSDSSVAAFWDALYDFGAEIVLNGHEHHYERFAPMDPSGDRDDQAGIRQFVVGTGGSGHYGFGTILPNSEARNANTYGVLKLTLHASGYDWQFVPEAGKSFADSGSAACH